MASREACGLIEETVDAMVELKYLKLAVGLGLAGVVGLASLLVGRDSETTAEPTSPLRR